MQIQSDILKELHKSYEYHKKDFIEFFSKHSFGEPHPNKKEVNLDLIPQKFLNEFNEKWEVYRDSEIKLVKVSDYLKYVLNNAESLNTVKAVVPEHYSKYVCNCTLTGEQTAQQLYDHYCFTLLEEAVLTNVLLGVN